MTDFVALSLAEARQLSISILSGHGLAADHVEAVTETIMAAERDGCASHGLYRLIVCAHTLKSNAVARSAQPRLSDIAPGLVRVDADGGFAPLAHRLGLPVLLAKARTQGIAAMALNNCVHFAALWPDIEPIAVAGLVGLACTPSHAWVAPSGGTEPVFGTNPIAFAWPRSGHPPMVFDFATSATARGEIELYRRQGRAIPDNWAIDAGGAATTDASAALDGAMLTFGGHKGSALALMIELIAGPLIGDLTSLDSIAHDGGRKASPLGGVLILAFDPKTLLGDRANHHLNRAETVFAAITDQGARLPSDRRYAARRRHADGPIMIGRGLYDDLLALAEI